MNNNWISIEIVEVELFYGQDLAFLGYSVNKFILYYEPIEFEA